jgi:hypothetical protein
LGEGFLQQLGRFARRECERVFEMKSVMAGLVPAIHVFLAAKTWIPGTSPGMTIFFYRSAPFDDHLREKGLTFPNTNAISTPPGTSGLLALDWIGMDE